MSAELTAALDRWTTILGPQNVHTHVPTCAAAVATTFPIPHTVAAVICPRTHADVVACVRVAADYRIRFAVSSTGKNWGYGTTGVPSGGVLFSLHRMTTLVIDEMLATVTLEPGVTQRILDDTLRETAPSLWMDATGASPDCSVLGNTLTRGFGHTPYADHASHIITLTAVTPTGDVIQTGFTHTAGPAFSHGSGPNPTGLFCQSTFGIVTSMTLALMPAPAVFRGVLLMTDDTDGAAQIHHALRPLALAGIVPSATHVSNVEKIYAASLHDPDRQTPHVTDVTITHWRRSRGIGVWNGTLGIYASSRADARRQIRAVRRALRRVPVRIIVLSDLRMRLLSWLPRWGRWQVGKTYPVLAATYGLLRGRPTEQMLAGAYWATRYTSLPHDPDPARDGCGLIWIAVVVPRTLHAMQRAIAIVYETLIGTGILPQITLASPQPRTVIMTVGLSFDRSQPDAAPEVIAIGKWLLDRLDAHHFPTYRLASCYAPTPTLWETRLASVFDPDALYRR